MKLSVKLFITGIIISILMGFICAKIRVYEDENTHIEQATVVQSIISYNNNGSIDEYITIIEYNYHLYRFSGKDIYDKYHSKINNTIDVEVCTYKLSNLFSFLDDEDEVKLIL